MNWNNYDTKYIIKRLIIGFGMLILFSILTTNKAKALTTSEYIQSPDNNNNYLFSTREISVPLYNENNQVRNLWNSYGEGNIIFSYAMWNDTDTTPIYDVEIFLSNGSAHNIYQCSIGNYGTYWDNTTQVTVATVNCSVNIRDGFYFNRIRFYRTSNVGTQKLKVSNIATWVSKDNPNVSVNVNQQDVVNAINGNQQAMTNAIQSAGAQAHTDSQAVQQAINNANNQAHQDAQQIHNDITNDNVDGANSDLESFKNSSTFSDSTGLQAVIELPLNLVNSFTNTCQPISITIPWLDYTGTIPCMSTIYRQHFNNLYSVVELIVNAFFIYRILLKIYELVHEAKQPDEDKLEVIDL